MGLLYKLDFASGKSYLGITIRSAKYRFAQHRAHSKKGVTAVYKAWRKYGAPKITVLAIVETEDLAETEIRAIRVFGTKTPNGYNMADGGNGSSGVAKTKEAIEKTRAGCLGKKRTAEFCERMSRLAKGKPAWNKGKPASDEARERSRQSHLGYKHREESLAKMGAASKARVISAETRKKMWATRKANKLAQQGGAL